MNQRRSLKKIVISTIVAGWVIFLALVFGCNIWIIASTRSQVFYNVAHPIS